MREQRLLFPWALAALLVACRCYAADAERVILLEDALGESVSGGEVTVTIHPPEGQPGGGGAVAAPAAAAVGGGIKLPNMQGARYTIQLSHPEYGLARAEFEDHSGPRLILPVVKRDSPAYARALRGRVVGPDDKPVPGAAVKCSHVQTAGRGIMSAATTAAVVTGKDGRFTIYVPDAKWHWDRRHFERFGNVAELPARARLIPPNALFHLYVELPGDDGFFPAVGDFSNVEPATVRLQKSGRPRVIKYENPAGGFFTEPDALRRVRLGYYKAPDAHDHRVDLPPRYVSGGRLAPGTYRAELDPLRFVPLVVTEDSPDELVFKLPPPVTYSGRVTDGVTGKPLPGAFVVGATGGGRRPLAELEPADWQRLRAAGRTPKRDDPSLEPLKEVYTFDSIVRTDDEGRYDLTHKPGQPHFSGLVVFDQDRLPIRHALYDTKPDAKHRAEVRDLPLFPSARVLVRLVFKGGEPGYEPMVTPEWVTDPRGQPQWFPAFRAVARGSERTFEYDARLKLNERHPFFVPAGVSLWVQFRTPYNDEWSPGDVPDLLKLDGGQTKDLGDIGFEPSLRVTVKVTDETGRPVEGAPVRRLDDRRNVWSVAHESDARGVLQFHVRPRSTGQFAITDLPGRGHPNVPANLKVAYEVGDKPDPPRIFTIRMTREQVELLHGPKPGAV